MVKVTEEMDDVVAVVILQMEEEMVLPMISLNVNCVANMGTLFIYAITGLTSLFKEDKVPANRPLAIKLA